MVWLGGTARKSVPIEADTQVLKLRSLEFQRHRVVLSPSAELEGTTTDDVLSQLLAAVEVPR